MLSPFSGLGLSMASHSDRDFRPFTIVLQSVLFVSPRNMPCECFERTCCGTNICGSWEQHNLCTQTNAWDVDIAHHLIWDGFCAGLWQFHCRLTTDKTQNSYLTIYVISFVALAFAILPYLNIPKVKVMRIDQHDNSIFNSVLIVLMYILLYKAFENQTMKSMDFHSRFGPGSKRLTNTNYRQRKSKLRRFLLHVEKSWTSGGGVWFQKLLQSVNQTSWFLPEVAMHAVLIIRGASSILSSTGGKNDVGLFSLFPREK